MTDAAPEKAHASLGASKMQRIMACPGSLVLEAPFPDTSSEFADEGTAAHTLMEWCLTAGQDASAYAGRIITVEQSGRKFEVGEEMVENVQALLDFVAGIMATDPAAVLLVEKKVDFSRFIEQPDAWGTADVIIVLPTLHKIAVVDLKYGRGVAVSAKENEQLSCYGLGAYDMLELAYEFDAVELVIFQPRIDNISRWETTVDQLLEFGQRARVACRIAMQHVTGEVLPPTLNPGPKQCKFCKAKATCPALAADTRAVVSTAADVSDFEDVTAETLAEGLTALPPPTLAQAMAKVELLELAAKAIRAEVERRLVRGDEVPGFKLVAGKRGARAWVNADEAELVLKGMRLKTEEMYTLKLVSPTQAEKLSKDGVIGPRQWKKIEGLYAQSPGKPSVAPETDKRPAITVAALASDFDDVTPCDLA